MRKKKTPRLRSGQVKKVRAIIYDIKNDRLCFLILHRTLRWKGWEFLKETIEKGETPLKAVKRGIREEAQIKKFEIIKDLKKKEKWQVGENIYEIVSTFLIKAEMRQKISLKQEIIEHDKYQWVDKKTALKKITWPETREILKRINRSLFI